MPVNNRQIWMRRLSGLALIVMLVSLLVAVPVPVQAAASSDNCDYGTQSSGAYYQICMPPSGIPWNGDVMLFAHGYVGYDQPLAIQFKQFLLMDNADISKIITQAGYAFATSSYSENGLAVQPGVKDMVDLSNLFKQRYPEVKHRYLVGVSEGGLVTTLAVERFPQDFTAGLAMCGPIGDFSQQVNYWGNFRVLFDNYFPGLLPGSAIDIPQSTIEGFYFTYWPVIKQTVKEHPEQVKQLLQTAGVAFDPNNPASMVKSVYDNLWYSVYATDNGQQVLGGQPFSNITKSYSGSYNDQVLNIGVPRYKADPSALKTIASDYTTTGVLKIPLVTMHNLDDQIVPYWHESEYYQKVVASGSQAFYSHISIPRYGHCDFNSSEALAAFVDMSYRATGQLPLELAQVLTTQEGQQTFYQLLETWGLANLGAQIPNLPFNLLLPGN